MATRYYLTNDDQQGTAVTTFRGAWDSTAGATTHRLGRTRSGAATSDTAIDNVVTNPLKRCLARFVSEPLAGQSISGTLSAKLMFRETDAAANMTCAIHVFLVQGDTNTLRSTLLSTSVDSTEFAVDSSLFSAISLSGVALSTQTATAGDRIVVEIGMNAANAVATSYTMGMKFGGSATDADGTEAGVTSAFDRAPWIEFSGTVDTGTTIFYLTNSAAPATPSAQLGAWDASGSSVDKLLSPTAAGSKTNTTVTETSTSARKDENARFISLPLAAQTISAVAFNAVICQLENSTSADAFTHFHLYLMKPDGTLRATLLSNSTAATELSVSVNRHHTATLTSQAVTAGDRLVLEIGTSFTNVSATSFNSGLYFGGVSSQAAVGENATATDVSSWIEIAQVILFQTTTPKVSFVMIS